MQLPGGSIVEIAESRHKGGILKGTKVANLFFILDKFL